MENVLKVHEFHHTNSIYFWGYAGSIEKERCQQCWGFRNRLSWPTWKCSSGSRLDRM